MQMIKLGSRVTETSTGLKGMLVQYLVKLGGNRFYLFGPNGVNAESKVPIKPFWVAEEQIKGGEFVPEPDMRQEILGSTVTDMASGYSGTALGLTLHISGCLHVCIQASGKTEKGEVINDLNFDLRQCSDPRVPKWTEAEIEKDKRDKPSPGPEVKFSVVARG